MELTTENWSTAVSEAVGRGVHISARTPFGYRRDEGSRLLAEEPAASAVRELFRRRATGASWAELARFLDEQGTRPPTGNPHWSKQGVTGVVANPVYLGQARSGKVVNDDAHEPLVTRAEFDAAQGVKKSLLSTSLQFHRARSILCGPIWTSAPRMVTPGITFRAMAPAATRIAVSRADCRPPPR